MTLRSPGPERRIAAVVLPSLLCELVANALSPARSSSARSGSERASAGLPPFAVVLTDDPPPTDDADSEAHGNDSEAHRNGATAGEIGAALVPATAVLHAVSPAARRYGVREGQTIAEACALVAHLVVRTLRHGDVAAALGRAAEAALGFGATVSFEAPDTVWVDVTGVAHLFDRCSSEGPCSGERVRSLQAGEAALGAELAERLRSLGHAVRVAIAPGPRLAQALARWSPAAANLEQGGALVSAADAKQALGALPIRALPLDVERAAWFTRLGVLSIDGLARLPRAALATRLGEHASTVLELCEGKDDAPLVAYRPPVTPVEESLWDEPQEGVQPLLFVLRGLAARLSLRLAGRGEAAQSLVLSVLCDRGLARLHAVPAELELRFELAVPLWREEELARVVSSRLERTQLAAPAIGLRLAAPSLTHAHTEQLGLSRVLNGLTGSQGLEQLPVLLAELGADLGKDRVGTLRITDSHRPEARSKLGPALRRPGRSTKKRRSSDTESAATLAPLRKTGPVHGSTEPAQHGKPLLGEERHPTRLLPKPVRLTAVLRVGATVIVDHRLYSIAQLRFEQRLETVEWWSRGSTSTAAPPAGSGSRDASSGGGGAPSASSRSPPRGAVSRDYLRLWLTSASPPGPSPIRPSTASQLGPSQAGGGLEAWVYVDRETGERYLQALSD